MNRDFWDIKADRGDFAYLANTPSTMLNALLSGEEMEALASAELVLDAGSGTGTASIRIGQMKLERGEGGLIYCFDYSRGMLEKARTNIAQVLDCREKGDDLEKQGLRFKFVQGSLTDLPPSVPTIDALVCLNVMQEFPKEMMEEAISELYSILDSSGNGYVNFVWELPFRRTFSQDPKQIQRVLLGGGRVFIDGVYKTTVRDGDKLVVNDQTCLTRSEMDGLLSPFDVRWAKVMAYDTEKIRQKYLDIIVPDKFDTLCSEFGGFPDSYLFKVGKND